VFVPPTRKTVESLLIQGLRPNQIAQRLGLAPQTVRYHVARIRRGATDGRRKPRRPVEVDESIRR
jgi:DNA-binding CsgD family transcriptional regulator